jgi:hypothetical protein
MLAEQREPGKKWIELQLPAALQETGASLEEPLLWRLDFNTQCCTLDTKINEEQKSWTFSYEDVSDCRNTPETQDEIRRWLRVL